MSVVLVDSLESLTRAHPHERKRLLGPDLHFGRELLLALAMRTGGWIGWEAENLRGIARELAFVPLAELGLQPVADAEVTVLVNRALTQCIEKRRVGTQFVELSDSLGFRRSLSAAVLELRTAGVAVAEMRTAALPGTPASDLATVLEAYEALLERERLADVSSLFALALEYFDREADFVLDGELAVAPTLRTRGLSGQLLARVVARGAHVLAGALPEGLDRPPHFVCSEQPSGAADAPLLAWACAPIVPEAVWTTCDRSVAEVDVFAAATPDNEIREVLRRVVTEGWRWDDVEIVATDSDTYGIALDALCQRLDIGVTMLRGVPLARTRVGRAIDRWFTWIGDGLPADTLRQALEAGEVNVKGGELASTVLARELRALNIGWGRARYEAALARIESGERTKELTPYEDESGEEFAERLASRERASRATGELIGRLLAVVPAVPERGGHPGVKSSCPRLARATLGFLDLVPVHGQAEAQSIARLRARLELLSNEHDEEMWFASALAALRESLADLRAWPLQTNERKPWSATGGMVHLTDVAHGGTTGRRRVFVVGLDAERAAGGGSQDPFLPDSLRIKHFPGRLTTVAERREEGAFVVGSMLASLRGRVTLSYSHSITLDDREAGPSPTLLQAWRLVTADPSATYDSFREKLRPPASPVPSAAGLNAGCLDARDVWLQALSEGALLLDASQQLQAGYPDLAQGEKARLMALSGDATPYHGLVPGAGPSLDLTAQPDWPVSPSALELIAKCPLAWFYRHGIRLKRPSESEFDASRWLDAAQRGTVLHQVFERFAKEFVDRQDELEGDAATNCMREVARDAINEWRALVPPPTEAAFDREKAELETSAQAFLLLERSRRADGDGGRWLHFEYEFGYDGEPGLYELPNGKSLAVRGRADRVDELPDGTLRVVDYKSGSPSPFGRNPKAGPFAGGRNLQPAIYVAAVEEREQRPVSAFEYRFPTAGGANHVVAYSASELAESRSIVGVLVDSVRAGRFLPTFDKNDCRYCDYQRICRAEEDRFGNLTVPRVEWAKENVERLDEYESMRALRSAAQDGHDE